MESKSTLKDNLKILREIFNDLKISPTLGCGRLVKRRAIKGLEILTQIEKEIEK